MKWNLLEVMNKARRVRELQACDVVDGHYDHVDRMKYGTSWLIARPDYAPFNRPLPEPYQPLVARWWKAVDHDVFHWWTEQEAGEFAGVITLISLDGLLPDDHVEFEDFVGYDDHIAIKSYFRPMVGEWALVGS